MYTHTHTIIILLLIMISAASLHTESLGQKLMDNYG